MKVKSLSHLARLSAQRKSVVAYHRRLPAAVVLNWQGKVIHDLISFEQMEVYKRRTPKREPNPANQLRKIETFIAQNNLGELVCTCGQKPLRFNRSWIFEYIGCFNPHCARHPIVYGLIGPREGAISAETKFRIATNRKQIEAPYEVPF